MQKNKTNSKMIPLEELIPLISRSKSGERAAMEELMEKIYGYVRRRTAFICGSSQYSSDIAQNALFKIASGLPRLRKPEAFIGWTERIIKNECSNHFRGNHIRENQYVVVEPDDPVYSIKAEQFEKIAREDALKIISTMAKKLTPKERTALYLKEYEGLDSNEIGKAMGIKPSTARVLYKRAGAKLFKMISAENQEGSL